MAFFSDLFNGLTGQQSTPQQTIIPTDELLGQTNQLLTSKIAPGTIAYNQALAPGMTDVGLGVTNQFDPSVLQNLRGAQSSILNQLNLGTQMDPQLQAEITRNLLATNAATGFGASAGGVGNILYQTAIDKQNLLRQRQQDALNAGSQGFQLSRELYQPTLPYGQSPGFALSSDIRSVQAAKDDYANLVENTRLQNFKSLINTAGRITGTVIGGIYGGAAGAQMGGQVGGSLYTGSGVAGYNNQQGSGGGGGMLGGLFGGSNGGFGRFTGGAGQNYGDANGNVQTSTRAQGVSLAGWDNGGGADGGGGSNFSGGADYGMGGQALY